MARQQTFANVTPITFENSSTSTDGEGMIFTVNDRAGNASHIVIEWAHVGVALQVIQRAAENCAAHRKMLNKSNDFDPRVTRTFHLVRSFQVSDCAEPPLKILSLQNPIGFRFDFAIPTNTQDQRGRSIHRAIAEELVRDQMAERKQPM
jgi:hypothetical protein